MAAFYNAGRFGAVLRLPRRLLYKNNVFPAPLPAVLCPAPPALWRAPPALYPRRTKFPSAGPDGQSAAPWPPPANCLSHRPYWGFAPRSRFYKYPGPAGIRLWRGPAPAAAPHRPPHKATDTGSVQPMAGYTWCFSTSFSTFIIFSRWLLNCNARLCL